MKKITNRNDFQFFAKLIGVSFLLFIIWGTFCNAPIQANTTAGSHQYFNGEVLFPDYAISDTLVVNDAAALNYIFDSSETKDVPATDGEINEVLRRYCIPLSGHICRWKLCPYKGLQPYQYKDSVLSYTGEPEGSEAVQLDLLHLLTPDADYDELVKMMEED